MEPLNEKERTVGLLKFLGLFLVLFILTSVAIYYDYQMPKKQLALLREENEKLKSGGKDIRLVLVHIDSAKAKLGRYSVEPNKERLNLEISNEIFALSKYALADSSTFGNIVQRIGTELNDHLTDKKSLVLSGNCSEKIAEYEKQVQQFKADLKECGDQLDKKTLMINSLTK